MWVTTATLQLGHKKITGLYSPADSLINTASRRTQIIQKNEPRANEKSCSGATMNAGKKDQD